MLDNNALEDVSEGKQKSHKVGFHFLQFYIMYLSCLMPTHGNE